MELKGPRSGAGFFRIGRKDLKAPGRGWRQFHASSRMNPPVLEPDPQELQQLRAECDRWRQDCARLQAENAQLRQRNGVAEVELITREFAAFAYAVSHDLKEPLRKVQVFGERLEKAAAGNLGEQSLDYLTRMRAAARRMGDMIEGLLEVSRVTTRGEAFAEVDLETVVREAQADVETFRLARGARVRCGELPHVRGDAHQLRRLFANLLSNSFQYARPGVPAAVSIHSEASPGEVSVVVEDNGSGLAAEDAERIFEVFTRLDSNGPVPEGSGVGLTICRKIMERHGGTIVATGKIGEGTQVRVTFRQD